MYSQIETAQSIVEAGVKKTEAGWFRLLVLSFIAGVFIAFACVGANIASSLVENASIAKLLSAMVFPVGLGMIFVACGELFTGNCMIVMAVFQKRVKVWPMLRNWLLVLLGNFLGAIFIAWLSSSSGQFSLLHGMAAQGVLSSAVYKVSLPFANAFGLGVLCNIVVCTAVYLGYAGKTAGEKMVLIYMPVMLFVLAGLEHCVTNAYYVSAGIFAAQNPAYATAVSAVGGVELLTWSNMLLRSLLPTTLGNILGGVLIGTGFWFIHLRAKK